MDVALRTYRLLIAERPRHTALNRQLGGILMHSGPAEVALPFLRVALESEPAEGTHWIAYIDALTLAGRADAANAMLAQARRRGIDDATCRAMENSIAQRRDAYPGIDALEALGTLFGQRRFAEMEARARELAAQFPNHGAGWKALGTALALQGRAQHASVALEQAAALFLADTDVLISLGNLLRELGRRADAESRYRRAIQLDPRNADAHRHLGIVLCDRGEFQLAEASCRRALELNPVSAEALSNLARVLLAQGQLADAEHCLRNAVNLRPDRAESHYDLATLQSEQFRFDDAVTGFRCALRLKPTYVPARTNLGVALIQTGRYAEAETTLRMALNERPNDANALAALSDSLACQGRPEEGDACLQAAIAAHPTDLKLRSRRLFNLNLSSGTAATYRVQHAREFGLAMRDKSDHRFTAWTCADIGTRPHGALRVGIVSGDLCNHPVGYFFESLAMHVDRARIELVAFPTNHQHDALTARIKPAFVSWLPIAGLNDDAAARAIHAAGIQVLIDLSGHTAGSRLGVFAQKPAPIQASWLGYFATTGVAEMDYLIADPVSVRETEFEQFTETIVHLPETRLCFTPPAVSPPVLPAPMLRNGHITFGCFQNLAKIGDEVLALWSTLLAAMPEARLRLQCRELGYSSALELTLTRMQAAGIDCAKVNMLGRVGRDAYLAAYGEVDIVLDTFPYPGGTTTCEALWMGVPTLTLAGSSLLSRQGASLLTAAGLPDWVAGSAAEYRTLAIARASDPDAIATLRRELRPRVAATPLFDAPRFARHFEQLVWEMWRQKNTQ